VRSLGYFLASEEHDPRTLVANARRAEELGFEFALISDHFHPWIDRQGQSPFVWAVIGGIAQATSRLRLGTAVTCPIIRIHPVIVAQAAATAAAMMPGRFMLGVGTGENLNEHITGAKWPRAGTRLQMLEEAVSVIRLLWEGGVRNHEGKHFTVENARIYTLPDEPPPLLVGATGPRALALAGRIGDGLITLYVDRALVDRFRAAGGEDKARYGLLAVCWADSEAAARRIVLEYWPNAGLPGGFVEELALPRHVERASSWVDESALNGIVFGPDADRHVTAIEQAFAAGYDHVCVCQLGPDQDGFFGFYEREVLPRFAL
jgi:G6PDH family F420-dependent oxidoreductase